MMRLRRRPRLTVEPVRSYPTPGYPTIDCAAQSPAGLLHCIPEAWKSNAAALSALAAFVLAGRAEAQEPTKPPAPAEDAATTAKRNAPEAPAPAPSIAPVFVHGEGRGSTGCIVVSPPEFLSEAEALELIWEELEREDLGFESRTVAVPVRADAAPTQVGGARPSRTEAPPRRPLFFDAYSTRLHCGVLVVGAWNYGDLGREADGASLERNYDTIGRAQEVTERLARESTVSAGVFYDPLVKMHTFRYRNLSNPGNARELLRAQVREFVDWAKRSIRVAQSEAAQ